MEWRFGTIMGDVMILVFTVFDFNFYAFHSLGGGENDYHG